ncbi:MAG: NAD(P)-dependent oxidoreductase, partial [Burkholderiales bacterium]
PVANVPGVNAQTVAEYCIASCLALAHRIVAMDRDHHAKGWSEGRAHADHAIEMAGRTIGVVGVGAIGTKVAEIASRAFGMKVLGYQRRLDALPDFVAPASIDQLCAQSDFITLNCPLTPATRHLINEKLLRSMKPTAFIVNVARGPVIDEDALARVLAEGKIAGAALDVYSEQPLPRDHAFLTLPNVILTPHAAGLTQEASHRMSEGAALQILQLLKGERPTFMVNPEIWPAHLERVRRWK